MQLLVHAISGCTFFLQDSTRTPGSYHPSSLSWQDIDAIDFLFSCALSRAVRLGGSSCSASVARVSFHAESHIGHCIFNGYLPKESSSAAVF